ncbi:MAG: ABC transporter ATP-binding protein [Thermomicrobiales bacterium]|nr:ABC transporter ATP-binding protein [Thermomicrobiales bacterium]
MARVTLQDVTKRYGDTIAVDRVSAEIADGEFVTLLGPSGCGKTTTLRMIAGLVELTSGHIRFDDQLMDNVPTHKRNIGLAFQSHALFPHMSVAKNIAFGLTNRRAPKAEVQAKVEEMLDMIEMTGMGDRMPSQLSGGQQQRVALARMLATDPRVLLFDEPLSALDRNLRDTLKYSILELQRRTRKTAIYVTHDQSEAFAISDRIMVMNQGRVEQAGTQLDIYLRPETEFVANFVGDNNTLQGTVRAIEPGTDGIREVVVDCSGMTVRAIAPADLAAGDAVSVFVRPEHIEVLPDGSREGQEGVLRGKIVQLVFEGPTLRMTIDADGVPLHVSVSGTERLALLDQANASVWVELRNPSVVKNPPAV